MKSRNIRYVEKVYTENILYHIRSDGIYDNKDIRFQQILYFFISFYCCFFLFLPNGVYVCVCVWSDAKKWKPRGNFLPHFLSPL